MWEQAAAGTRFIFRAREKQIEILIQAWADRMAQKIPATRELVVSEKKQTRLLTLSSIYL